MKRFDSYRIRLVLVGFVAAIVFSGGIVKADFTFGEPTNLGPTVNSSANDWSPSISADGLSLYFGSMRPGGYPYDLWVTTRDTKDEEWGTPVNLGAPVNSSTTWEVGASISTDGLSLFFESDRSDGYGQGDIWVTTRPTVTDPWGTPVNSSTSDRAPSISADGLSLFFTSNRPGGYGHYDLWVTTRETKDDEWGTPVNLGATVNSSTSDSLPSISADGLQLYFSDYWVLRPGGLGAPDLWVTTRATTDDLWGTPVNLGLPINSSAYDGWPSISADGSTLFFGSERAGGYGNWDIWQVSISPIVDFNADGNVDLVDLVMLIDNWDTDDALYDIGPMPWGDGVVDVQDLKVFIIHWEEENMGDSEGAERVDRARRSHSKDWPHAKATRAGR